MFLRKSIFAALCFGLVGLTMHLSAEPAMAQVRAALTKNVDEPGRMPFTENPLVLTSTCTFNSVLYFCRVNFSAVPAGKRLVVEHISSFIALSATGSPDSIRFIDRFGGTAEWVQPTFTTRVNTTSHFFLDRPTLVYYEPGDTPQVLVATTVQPTVVEVILHGYFIDAAN
jgi:hypothetical protein